MKCLRFACAAIFLSGVTLLAAAGDSLPLQNPLPKPAPLIILIDGPGADARDAATPAVPTASSIDSNLPADAPEPGSEAAPSAIVALAQPAPPDAEANTAAVPVNKSGETLNKVWAASVAAFLGGTAADAASSWGKSETNPLLRSANGAFGMKGLMVKGGLAGAVVAPEILMRNDPEARKKFAIVNFVAAGVFSAAVLHNISIPKLKP
jgi:hypothetical protein